MTLDDFIHEVGGNVERKRARVEKIERAPEGYNLVTKVRILDPSTVSVDRLDTWLVKVDGEEVKCFLQPTRFDIYLTVEFILRGGEVEGVCENLVEALLDEVKVGDELVVLHIRPAINAGKYCKFESAAA